MIKIKKYDQEGQRLTLITDMSNSLANAIRRSVLEIPVLAIEDLEIFKNDSALYDEIVAHRMGLIPIKTDKTSKEKMFKLKEKGPKTVYSSDLKPSIETDYKLPIVKLDENQEIEVIANAKLGKGIEHIKYSPGLIYFRHNLDEEILDFVNIENGKIKFNEEELEGLDENLKDKIKKIKESNELIMEIESWRQFEVKEVFLKSIEILDENLKQLSKIK